MEQTLVQGMKITPGNPRYMPDEKRQRKLMLIIGGAKCVWKDYERAHYRAKVLDLPVHRLAVNAVGMYVPDHLHYWFSLHCDFLVKWAFIRQYCTKWDEKPKPAALMSFKNTGQWCKPEEIDCTWQFGDKDMLWSAKQGGSLEDSGFLAMCIALAMGYERVWLVGCPADDSGHVFIPDWRYLQHDKEAIQRAWMDMIEKYPMEMGRVRSCSGLTQAMLGDIEL